MTNKPISKVESQNESFDLGATFDNVFLSDEDDLTLKEFYEYVKDYFDQDMFMMYSEDEPAADNVKIWYDTTEEVV